MALVLPSLEGGGAERVFVDLANELSNRGRAVDLVLGTVGGPYAGEVGPRVRVVDLGTPRMARAVPRLAAYLRAARPAALLSALDTANVASVVASVMSGQPTRCVVSIRAMPGEVYRRAPTRKSRMLMKLSRCAVRRADAVVANSRAVARDVAAFYGLPASTIAVIRNPVDADGLRARAASPAPHAWCADGAPPFVLGVGRLTPLKDFGTLLRAFARLGAGAAFRLVILGEGPEREALEALARDLGIADAVLMPGFATNPFAWMGRAALMAGSSLTEGCPNAIQQALALGVPVVATDCPGGTREMLSDGRYGRLVPVGDVEAMAAALRQALEGRSQAAAWDEAATLGLPLVADRYLDVLLPGRAPARDNS